MSQKKEIRQQYLTGERPLFMGKDLKIYDTIFDNGESPLKESRNIELYGSMSNGNIRSGTAKIFCRGLYMV